MWSHCFKTILFKYSRSYSVFLAKRLKLEMVNPLQPNVTRINRIHKFSVCNSLVASYKDNEKFQKTENSGLHRKKFRQLTVKEILKKIQVHKNFFESPFSVTKTIDILDKSVELEKWTKRDIERILQHEGFIKFVRAVDNYISELPMQIDDKLIKVLKIYTHLQIPCTNLKCEEIISLIEKRLNYLSFGLAADFYLVLRKSKTYLNYQLLQKLEEMMIVDLKKGIYNESIDYAVLSLIICKHYFVTNEVREMVLIGILKLQKWDSFAIHKYFIQVLSELGMDHPSYEHIKNDYFEKLKNRLVDINSSLAFLTGYASSFFKNKIDYYDAKLIDEIVNKGLEKDLTLLQFIRLMSALQLIRHVNYNVLEHIIGLIKSNSPFLRQSTPALKVCIQSIADSNHDEEQENRWDGIQPFMQDLLVSCNFFQDIGNYFDELLHSIVRLASLGIYDDESLRVLSSHINHSKKLKHSVNLMYMTGLLHQAVRVFHPSFHEPLINDDVLSFIVSELNDLNLVPFQKFKMLTKMKEDFYQASFRSGTMLLNRFTKSGMLIDGVVAMNNTGDLHSFDESQKKYFIEDISIPENFKLVAIMALTRQHYSRNTRSLKSYCSLHLKILKALGYDSVCVYEEDLWNEGQYVLNKIRERRCGKVLTPQVEASLIDSGD